jgi:hypothetical protein
MVMKRKIKQIIDPVWQYMQQPVFSNSCRSVWHIKTFLRLYNIHFLEKCFKKDISSESHYQ